MSIKDEIVTAVNTGYAFDGPALDLGALVVDGEPIADAQVRIPLAMLNRHGLVAGATGTGKRPSASTGSPPRSRSSSTPSAGRARAFRSVPP
jgi:hypothetical protein